MSTHSSHGSPNWQLLSQASQRHWSSLRIAHASCPEYLELKIKTLGIIRLKLWWFKNPLSAKWHCKRGFIYLTCCRISSSSKDMWFKSNHCHFYQDTSKQSSTVRFSFSTFCHFCLPNHPPTMKQLSNLAKFRISSFRVMIRSCFIIHESTSQHPPPKNKTYIFKKKTTKRVFHGDFFSFTFQKHPSWTLSFPNTTFNSLSAWDPAIWLNQLTWNSHSEDELMSLLMSFVWMIMRKSNWKKTIGNFL